MHKYLIVFNDGSTKEFMGECWAYSGHWRLYSLDGSYLLVNACNVNYIQRFDHKKKEED